MNYSLRQESLPFMDACRSAEERREGPLWRSGSADGPRMVPASSSTDALPRGSLAGSGSGAVLWGEKAGGGGAASPAP